MKRTLTGALVALTLMSALAPAIEASAQGRGHEGGGDRGGGRGGGDRGGAVLGGLGLGLALGAALGTYGGRPYYCREHHHWRWSRRQGRYVYDYRSGSC